MKIIDLVKKSFQNILNQKNEVKDVNQNAFFGPGQPMLPVAQSDSSQVKGRQFDYNTNYNQYIKAKTNEQNSFEDLRALAENCDILATVIQQRKDELIRFEYEFKLKDTNKIKDQRCIDLEKFFQNPDKKNSFRSWLGALVGDLLILDSIVIYPRFQNNGQVFSLELMDPATITKKIDGYGRTPIEGLAYQQILKGVPAIDYDFNELIYKHKNIRTNHVYGYSPVEQILNTVNTAIYKQIEALNYYNFGNQPDLIFSTPQEWNPDQINDFANYWNEVNNTQSKKIARFVPSGISPFNTKPEPLKNEFDEWLTRIICYAFSIQPTPFISQVNRATAQTAQEVAQDQGLVPLQLFFKEFFNYIILKVFKYDDIEFKWKIEEESDPLIEAQINEIYLNNKVLDVNEVRSKLQLEPKKEENNNENINNE